ncbi:hypothetical protein EfmJHP36_22030 [Enterococcus faecium]|nr:hypothetical protein EfmJHP36_22030 [Enterococcus faecium]
MLTAKDDQVDRIIGLEIGADDYLTKPFSPREVLARMKAIFRRIEPRKQSKDEAEPEDLSISDILGFSVYNSQSKEFEFRPGPIFTTILLADEINRKDRVIDRDTLLDRIWNFDFAGQSRIVDVHVSHLREKIERDPKHPKYLVTIRGFGYKFQEPKR